jgi:hypothetical protein
MSTCTKNDELLQCSKCGEMKPEDCFHRDKARKSGLCYECKACRNAYIKKHRKEKRKQYGEVSAALKEVCYEKVCKKCKRLLPCIMFSRSITSKDCLFNTCKDCVSKQNRMRLYRISEERLDKMLAVETCQMPGCGRKLSKGKSTHFDHCHKSGKVRAVLCSRCNQMLGFIEKNMHLLRPMLDYIANHKADDESE